MSLSDERCKSSVQSSRLAEVIYGGRRQIEKLQSIWSLIENDTEFKKERRAFLNHSERYIDACRKVKRFQEIADERDFSSLEDIYDAYLAIDESLPLDVHFSMFIPIMTLHTSREQRQRWLRPAMTLRIIGAYSQTELAHGSNVRGIETTASYDRETQEFVIHSPTLTSMKWWPGGLAHTCTHSVVYANLLIDDTNYGPHPFMVQLRSLTDHSLHPGIETGDIGPKLGYNSMDNGYARFTHVRIPREDMLMGFAQVSPEGRYSKEEGAEKVAYGIMLDVRTRLCIHSAYVLARALTIAIRYSCVREQGFVDPKRGGGQGGAEPVAERVVMDYPTQQRVLMPLLALSYALHFTGASVKALYTNYKSTGDISLLPDLHATSAGLKAYITTYVSEGIEAARKMCGGHGFLVSAGFADLYTSYLPMCTLEGTKEVLLQQAGRYLLKQRLAAIAGKRKLLSPTTAYMLGRVSNTPKAMKPLSLTPLTSFLQATADNNSNVNPVSFSSFRDVAAILVELLRLRAALCIDAAARAVHLHSLQQQKEAKANAKRGAVGAERAERGDGGGGMADNLLAASVEICRAAEAHCELLILDAFYSKIAGLTLLSPTGKPSSSTNQPRGASQQQSTPRNDIAGAGAEVAAGGADDDHDSTGSSLPDASPEAKSLREMFVLLAVSFIQRNLGQFLLTGALAPMDVEVIGAAEYVLCASVRRDAVNIIEAWLFSDHRIGSTLGRSDGQVYEALYEATKQEPLNASTISEGYHKYLKYVIQKPYREDTLNTDQNNRNHNGSGAKLISRL